MPTRSVTFSRWPAKFRNLCDWSAVKTYARQGFGRLLGWAQSQQLDPLDTETIRAFVADLLEIYGAARAETVLSGVSLALMCAKPDERWDWIKEIQRECGRQKRQAHSSSCRKRRGRERTRSVPLEQWPHGIRSAWQAAISEGIATAEFSEFVDDEGAAAHWSITSKRNAERGYGQFLGWTSQIGMGPLVTSKAVKSFIGGLTKRPCSPVTIASYVEGTLTLMRVTQPDNDWDWLRRQVNRLKGVARHAPRRKDGRVVHAAELFDLGLRLMERASRRRPELGETAVLFRDGLLFVVLAMAPARATSFLRIRIGGHLDLESIVGSLSWSGDETKEKRPEHYPVWETVRQLIEEYVLIYRPALAGAYAGTELWLRENGCGPLGYPGFRRAINVRSTAGLGIAVSPHLVRDSLALTISEDAPESMELATILLHHASARSTIAYRHQASTISASRIAGKLHEQARHRAERKIREASTVRSAGDIDPVFAQFVG